MTVLIAAHLQNQVACQVSDKTGTARISLVHTSRRCVNFIVPYINSPWPIEAMATENLVTVASGIGLLPDGTMSLPETMLTSRQ